MPQLEGGATITGNTVFIEILNVAIFYILKTIDIDSKDVDLCFVLLKKVILVSQHLLDIIEQ